jgi:hypothetical protein
MLMVSVLVGLAMTAAVLGAIVPLLGDLVDRQRAQAAADAAARAGVIDGRAAAGALAAANGGVLVSWSESADEVTVVVDVGGQRARARATDAP